MNEALPLLENPEQIYTGSDNVARMFYDMQSYIYPWFSKIQILMTVLSKICFIIIPLIFITLMAYVCIHKKHSFIRKFKDTRKIISYVSFLVLYYILSLFTIKFTYGFSIEFSSIVLPLVAKLYGPLIAMIFSVIQLLITVVTSGSSLSVMLILVSAIMGLLYGLCFYRKKTRYTRCIGSKFLIVIIINVILTPLYMAWITGGDISLFMANSMVLAILTTPIESTLIYLSFRISRLLKNRNIL